MLTQTPTVDGFKNRKYKRTKQRKGKVYRMTSDPIGRTIKILIGKIGDTRVGDLVMRRNFTEQGAGKMAIYNSLISIAPWFPKYYENMRGVPLTPSIVWNRYHKMYWENSAPKISREHYTHDKKLRPLVHAVEKLFLRGTIITEEEAKQAGQYPHLKLV